MFCGNSRIAPSRESTLEKLRDRSPISSPATEATTAPRTRPCASIAASASSRSRRMRAVSRDANSVNATEPDEQRRQHDREQAFERAVALGEHRIGRLLDDDGAAHLVTYPDRMRRGNDHGPSVRRQPLVDGQDAGQRAVDLACRQQNAAALLFLEVLGRLRQHQRVERTQQSIEPLPHAWRGRVSRKRTACARALETARARQHVEIAVDHPDARRGARQALDDLLDFGRPLRDGGRRRGRQRDDRRSCRTRPRSVPSVSPGTGCASNSRGRSCSAVATACAVPASVRSCASRRKRSSSRTYS